MSSGGGGEGGYGGTKVDQPLSKIYTKVVDKKCNTTQKGIHSRPIFHNFYIPSPYKKLAKTFLTLPLDFNPFASMGQKVFKSKFLKGKIQHDKTFAAAAATATHF
jgi:hypothetical protein